MRKLIHFLLSTTFIGLIIFSHIQCNDNLLAEEASYIEIEEFTYSSNTSTNIPHPNSHNSINISDVWVSMDEQIVGVFELPCKIPVLTNGTHDLDIYPGIKVNGISGERIKYPFYEKYETDIVLSRGNSTKITPHTSYTDQALFMFKEQGQFEIAGTMLTKAPLSDTIAIIQNEIVFQGEHSAAIYLDSINTYFDIRNIDNFNFTNNNVFLELNFKSNINFNVGIIIINGSNLEQKEELIQLYSTDNWKKIYLDLSPLIGMGTIFSTFQIYFEGNYDNTHNLNAVYLDNLKLVFSK